MSEAELHMLKGRLQAGRWAKARRGELFFNLPRGYVRQSSGDIALDPDEQGSMAECGRRWSRRCWDGASRTRLLGRTCVPELNSGSLSTVLTPTLCHAPSGNRRSLDSALYRPVSSSSYPSSRWIVRLPPGPVWRGKVSLESWPKLDPSLPSKAAQRTWSRRSASLRDHRICCNLFMRQLTRKFSFPLAHLKVCGRAIHPAVRTRQLAPRRS
jgi:hypothetical protein